MNKLDITQHMDIFNPITRYIGFETCEVSSIPQEDFESYIAGLVEMITTDKDKIKEALKNNIILIDNTFHSITLTDMLILYKYVLSLYDETINLNNGGYVPTLFLDMINLGDNDIYEDLCQSIEESNMKREYFKKQNIDKSQFIEFFEYVFDNMEISALFFKIPPSSECELKCSFSYVFKLIRKIFQLKHDKEWKCRIVNKLFDKLYAFSLDDKTKYYRTDDNNDSDLIEEYNEAIDILHQISNKDFEIMRKYDSETRYNMFLNINDVMETDDVSYHSF